MNIPGDKVDAGEECFGYIGAGPPQGTSFHRYIFLVYEQKGHIEFKQEKRSETFVFITAEALKIAHVRKL